MPVTAANKRVTKKQYNAALGRLRYLYGDRWGSDSPMAEDIKTVVTYCIIEKYGERRLTAKNFS